MGVGDIEPTRTLGAPGQPSDRTLVASAPADNATRMGITAPCPVCSTANSDLETYCAECGFLLASAPGDADQPEARDDAGFALVENGTGRRIPLRLGVNTVGREGADVLLMDATVSRRHAEITVTPDGATVVDLGSTNGTQIDGTPIKASTPVATAPGAMIRFGKASFVLSGAAGISSPAEPTVVVSAESTPSDDATADAESVDIAARLTACDAGAADIVLSSPLTTVGRRASNAHIISGDPYVSGAHAQFTIDGGEVYVTDLGSTNGTLVNGEKLTAHQALLLLEGDEVQIGQGRYVLHVEAVNSTPDIDESDAEGLEELVADRADGDSE